MSSDLNPTGYLCKSLKTAAGGAAFRSERAGAVCTSKMRIGFSAMTIHINCQQSANI